MTGGASLLPNVLPLESCMPNAAHSQKTHNTCQQFRENSTEGTGGRQWAGAAFASALEPIRPISWAPTLALSRELCRYQRNGGVRSLRNLRPHSVVRKHLRWEACQLRTYKTACNCCTVLISGITPGAMHTLPAFPRLLLTLVGTGLLNV